jgi:hypothetical protein
MKTNKHQTLQLVKKERAVHSRDLVENFDYSPGTARSYLSYLGRQGLLERMGAGYRLSDKGRDRLRYFEVFGCQDIDCPLCQGKIGYLTCPHCKHQMSRDKAKILKKRDFLVVVRHPGVYCDNCFKLIFSETQAELLGIKAEK